MVVQWIPRQIELDIPLNSANRPLGNNSFGMKTHPGKMQNLVKLTGPLGAGWIGDIARSSSIKFLASLTDLSSIDIKGIDSAINTGWFLA